MYLCSEVTPERKGSGSLCPLASARRRVMQTSMGSVQVTVGRDVGKWLLKKKKEKKLSFEYFRSSRGFRGNSGGEE